MTYVTVTQLKTFNEAKADNVRSAVFQKFPIFKTIKDNKEKVNDAFNYLRNIVVDKKSKITEGDVIAAVSLPTKSFFVEESFPSTTEKGKTEKTEKSKKTTETKKDFEKISEDISLDVLRNLTKVKKFEVKEANEYSGKTTLDLLESLDYEPSAEFVSTLIKYPMSASLKIDKLEKRANLLKNSKFEDLREAIMFVVEEVKEIETEVKERFDTSIVVTQKALMNRIPTETENVLRELINHPNVVKYLDSPFICSGMKLDTFMNHVIPIWRIITNIASGVLIEKTPGAQQDKYVVGSMKQSNLKFVKMIDIGSCKSCSDFMDGIKSTDKELGRKMKELLTAFNKLVDFIIPGQKATFRTMTGDNHFVMIKAMKSWWADRKNRIFNVSKSLESTKMSFTKMASLIDD